MTGLPALLSQIRGLTVALCAVLFLAGPMADALLCAADDLRPPAATAQAEPGLTSSQSHGLAGHGAGEAQGVCQHGHAHAAPAFAEVPAACAAPQVVAALTPRPHSSPLPPSIAGPGLDRPPRA